MCVWICFFFKTERERTKDLACTGWMGGTADSSSKELSLVWKCVQVPKGVHKSSSSKDATGRRRYERRRRIQVWDVNRKDGTGVKRLESEGLERRVERDAAVQEW